jgi:hypothetical protein
VLEVPSIAVDFLERMIQVGIADVGVQVVGRVAVSVPLVVGRGVRVDRNAPCVCRVLGRPGDLSAVVAVNSALLVRGPALVLAVPVDARQSVRATLRS